MSLKKRSNPFYAALLVVGVLFAITACAYFTMTVRNADPRRPAESGMINFMSSYGTQVIMVELGLLTVLTFLAIGTDDYWTGEGKLTGEGKPTSGSTKPTEPPAAT